MQRIENVKKPIWFQDIKSNNKPIKKYTQNGNKPISTVHKNINVKNNRGEL